MHSIFEFQICGNVVHAALCIKHLNFGEKREKAVQSSESEVLTLKFWLRTPLNSMNYTIDCICDSIDSLRMQTIAGKEKNHLRFSLRFALRSAIKSFYCKSLTLLSTVFWTSLRYSIGNIRVMNRNPHRRNTCKPRKPRKANQNWNFKSFSVKSLLW